MANEEQLALLRKGVNQWNAWRRDRPDEVIDLAGADLRGANLFEANLTEAYLEGADLREADLREAKLQQANLQGANLTGTDLKSVRLQSANLQKADLKGAQLQHAYLRGANLQQAKLIGALLEGAQLQHASLHRANLQGAKLHEANLFEANLTGADLTGANLQGAQLQHASLHRANLQGAKLHEANLFEANLTGADLTGADLTGANLQGAKLHEANLFEARLQRAALQQADLEGANLQRANLRGANLEGAKLRGAELIFANLQGARLQRTILTTAQWPYVKDHPDAATIAWDISPELLESLGDPSFSRSIEFAPEHKQAGIQILSYFGQIVEQKYPDQNVAVTIRQEGLMVKMTITAPTGDLLEAIEKTLAEYGQVVAGALPPSYLLPSPLQAMQLEQQLEMANLQLKHQIAIHAAERALLLSSNEELRDTNQQLRYMTKSLQGMLKRALETNHTSVVSHTRQLERQGEALSHLLYHLIEERDGRVQYALKQLDEALLAQNEAEAEAALETIESEEPELLTRLKKMAERTMSSGTGFMLKELLERLFGM